jgi:hypothetical protein
MRLHTLLDNLTGAFVRADGKVALLLSMLSPVEPVQLAEFLQQRATTGSGHQQMDIIGRHMPTDEVNILRRAGLAHQLTQPYCEFPQQDQPALPGDPHQMVFQVIDCVGCLLVAHQPLEIPHCDPGCRCHLRSSERLSVRQMARSARSIVKPPAIWQGFLYFAVNAGYLVVHRVFFRLRQYKLMPQFKRQDCANGSIWQGFTSCIPRPKGWGFTALSQTNSKLKRLLARRWYMKMDPVFIITALLTTLPSYANILLKCLQVFVPLFGVGFVTKFTPSSSASTSALRN